ncbi:hypothetical protein F8M41_006949 [Gigaspora margarita]|uniref:F-box domain-containing protein n=1 Tax=Gigaspora margarita TaxID=4874 RepID=A0A8H4ERD7_GIGMA|nr:hypothetical protein F8M41_006949 [Gigaspora margarita]
MASKILDNMPELMMNILNNLNHEPVSLFACARVNRYWCKMSIPILWQDPFSLTSTPLFIDGYFSSLGEEEKIILRNCGINAKFSDPLFDYAMFLKALYPARLECRVEKWIEIRKFDKFDVPVTSIQTIVILLLKLLVLNGITLHQLFLHGPLIDAEIFNSLEKNRKYLSKLERLHVDLSPEFTNNNEFLKIFFRNTISNTINHLSLNFGSIYEPQVFRDLARLIEIPKKLKKFWLTGYNFTEFYGVIPALESQKNSLQEIILEDCVYNAEFKQFRNYSFPPDRCTGHELSFTKVWQVHTKTKIKVQCWGFLEELVSLRVIEKFCPNITYLYIKKTEFSTQLLMLIGNLQKLKALFLWCNVDNILEEELEIRVIRFAKILPLTLQCLRLGDWIQPYLGTLLDHCKGPLKNLLTDQREECH